MENNLNGRSTRVARGLRIQDRVVYFPKPERFNIIERKSTDSRRRSKSLEQFRGQPTQSGRRSTSVEPQMLRDRRGARLISVDGERRGRISGVLDLPRGTTQPGRRAIRSVSVDAGRLGCNSGAFDLPQGVDQPGRRAKRSISVDARRRGRNSGVTNGLRGADRRVDIQDVDASATIAHLAQSQAILANELIKMKDDFCAQSKKNDLLTKQDNANQKLIAKMAQEVEGKDEQIRALTNRLQVALNRIGNSCF